MPTANFQTSDYATEAADIERRRKMAEMLSQESMQPLQGGMSGGWAVPISPWQGAAKLAQGLVGSMGQREAGSKQAALAQQMRSRAMDWAQSAPQATPAQTQTLAEDGSGLGMGGMTGQTAPAQQPTREAMLAHYLRGLDNPMTAPLALKLAEEYGKPASQDALLRRQTALETHATPSGSALLSEQGQNQRFAGVSGNTAATQAGENQRFGQVSGNTVATVNAANQRAANQITAAAQLHATPSGSAVLAQGASPALSDDAKDAAAARYNIDGTLPPMGMGKDGARAREDILNRAALQAKSSGISPEDQRVTQIGNKANTAALAKLQSQQSMVGAFEKTFNKNADIALEYSKKVDRTGVPLVNSWINAGKRAIAGNPELSAYDAAVKATVNEYTKIISGSMGNTQMAEGEIKKVEGLLNAAQTPKQVEEVISFMKRETQNRMKGFAEQTKELRQSMNQGRRSTDKPAVVDFNSLPK